MHQVIWKHVRFSGMAQSDAHNLVRVLRMLKLRRAPIRQMLDRALGIALAHTLAVYDSAYIALALHYAYPLVTLDQRQSQAAAAEGVSLVSIATLT